MKGKVKITDIPRGYYAIKFDSAEDNRHALLKGPWMVADHYILVQRWRPNFLRNANKERKVAVWVRVPELPLELYNGSFLKRLGSTLGSMLKIDRLTSIHSRGQFARICVEIDLAKHLIPQVMVRGEVLNLEFEGLHSVCFNCGVYGHRFDACSVSGVCSKNEPAPDERAKGGTSMDTKVDAPGGVEAGAGLEETHPDATGKVAVVHLLENRIGDSNPVAGANLPRVVYGPSMLTKKYKPKSKARPPFKGESEKKKESLSKVILKRSLWSQIPRDLDSECLCLKRGKRVQVTWKPLW